MFKFTRFIGCLIGAALLIGAAGAARAQTPCSFSWHRVVQNGGLYQDYTTPVTAQPYQGPCMAFAFTAAMESMYEIEHANPFLSPNISEAWLDYRMFNNDQWKLELETRQTPAPEASCGNFPALCSDERDQCPVYRQVRPIAQAGDCYNITREYDESVHQWGWDVAVRSNAGKSWYRAGSVSNNLSLQSAQDIKDRILNHGPLVLRVNGKANIEKFRAYDATNVSYHGFAVMGWKEVGTCTQWLIKDSWPGMAGMVYTRPDPGIPQLLSSGDALAWQVADVSFQSSTGGAITAAGTAWPSFNSAAQCVQPSGLGASLNCWNAGADKGGCLSASGSLKGYTVSWQLNGSGGTLAHHNDRCAEIVGSGFTGTLTGTATDGCGRTVSRSCSFTAGPGPGGGPTLY